MRSPLVVIGALIAILGYAVVYNGLSNIIKTGYFPKGPVGVADSLFPHLTTGSSAPIKPSASTSAYIVGSGFPGGTLPVAHKAPKGKKPKPLAQVA